MKLSLAQLAVHLRKTMAAIYLISGDELFLKQQAMNRLRKAAKLTDFTERECLSLAQIDAAQFFSVLHTAGLFATKKLIEIDLQTALPNKEMGQIIQDYAINPNSNQIVIFNLPKLEPKISKSNWFIACEKKGVHIAIWPLTPEQFPQWIKQRAQKYNLTIMPSAINYLCELTAGNISAAAQAIEKLYLLKPTSTIDESLIQQVLEHEGRFSVFDLLDYILIQDCKHALQTLHHLQAEGTEPTIILWAITRELRMLSAMIVDKPNLTTLFQQYRVFARRQPHIKHFIETITLAHCHTWLAKAATIDAIIKGALAGNVWQALEMYCLSLTTRAV